MAKEKSSDKEERRKEKKLKKEKRSATDGVHKSSKKIKKETLPTASSPPATTTTSLIPDVEMDVSEVMGEADAHAKAPVLLGTLVPFANPLADEKSGKKVLKCVKKAAKNKSLKRGVKEVVKALRKSALATAVPSSTSNPLPIGIVVLAADISPMDVISHIPVLCEDHGIPYIFVPSRAELGAAGATKRPTSVVMVGLERGGKKEGRAEAEEGFEAVYADLVKVVVKAGRDVRV